MSGRKMEGSEEQKRQAARDAREQGKSASAVGASSGASKQQADSKRNDTHQEKLDLKRQGKHEMTGANTPEARPGSRDADTPDREKYPRL